MKSLHALSFVIPAIVFIAFLGCTDGSDGSNGVLRDPKQRWLEGEPCAPPCWEGIQPGITTPQEAASLLQASSSIDLSSIRTEEYPDENTGLISFTYTVEQGSWTGIVGYYLDVPTVVTTNLFVEDLCLGEIINSYGNPDYLLPTGYEVVGLLDLLWESHGFVFETQLSEPGARITQDTCDGTLYHFALGTPVEDIPSPMFFGITRDDLIPWNGYGDY